jgi:hypothetical protein
VEENTHSSKVLHFFQKLCSFLYFSPLFIVGPVLLDEKMNCELYGVLLEDNCEGYRKFLREKSESYRDLLKGSCEH